MFQEKRKGRGHFASPRSGQMCAALLPEKDRPILETAIHFKAPHPLTGDITDFGPFMDNASLTGCVVIQTVSEFLESFIKSDKVISTTEANPASPLNPRK